MNRRLLPFDKLRANGVEVLLILSFMSMVLGQAYLTPFFGQISARKQLSHIGFRAWQTTRP